MSKSPRVTTGGLRTILVINPNTNGGLTDRIRGQLSVRNAPDTAIEVTNPAEGPYSIETPADRKTASAQVVALVRARPGRDAYVLACFDDVGVDEARRLVAAPVLSMAQAAIEAAVETGERFTIVTTVDGQVPAIEALLAKYRAGGLGSVRACRVGVADAASRTAEAEELLNRQIVKAIRSDGSRTIVLGSGAYSGRADELGARYGVSFVDGLAAAVDRVTGRR